MTVPYNPWELTDEDNAYWEKEYAERVAASGIQYPRSDVLHPQHQLWLERKLPNYGDPPAKEDASQASGKPPKRSRDTKLGSDSPGKRARDKKLPTRRQGTP